MQIEKSEELKYLLQVYPQEKTFSDHKYDYCRLKSMFQRHLEQRNQGFSLESQKSKARTDLQCELRTKKNTRVKDKEKDTNNFERVKKLHPLDLKRPTVYVEKHPHSSTFACKIMVG